MSKINEFIKKYWRFISLAVLILILIIAAVLIFFFPPESKDSDSKTNEVGKKETQTKFEYFPARFEDFVNPPKMYGLWPYGVKGSNSSSHNEGHPGWDFELKKGSKLYAIADLDISQIHDGDHQDASGKVKVIETSAVLGGKNYHIVYHSVINIAKNIKAGMRVKAGEPIAEVGYPLSGNSYMIHFGIFPPNDSVGACPSDYFSDELQDVIKKIVSISYDQNTGKPFKSACVGRISKKLYYENYPESVKHLGGAEQWE